MLVSCNDIVASAHRCFGFQISGAMRMFESRRWRAMAVLLFGTAILLPFPAHAIELTGAWASQGDLCKLVFTKKGNTVVFAELSDLYGSGFLIEGNRIRGKAARCPDHFAKAEWR
jgi:hypothetical protein